MIFVEFAVVLLAIFIGARMGGIGIGYAGGLGVIVLAILGLPVDAAEGIPWDVLGIILCVIVCIAAMQSAGGLDWLVAVTEKLLRKNPKQITFFAPMVTYLMTAFSGTGHVAYSSIPVIAEVAKESGIRPSRPLSISVVASQVAIVASPISAAVVAMSSIVEENQVDYLQVLAVSVPTTFIGVMVGALVASRMGVELKDDRVYQERLAAGLVQKRETKEVEVKPGAKLSVAIFGIALVIVILYSTLTSPKLEILKDPTLPRSAAIMTFMLAAGIIIVMACKVPIDSITSQSTYKGGTSAAICILGVAWLGNTFVNAHIDEIKELGGGVISQYPWLLAVVLFFASALLYSQGATTITLMPVAQGMGVAASTMVASFPAVTGLYILPTYPTTVAAVEMDSTGSTRIGRYVFNHPFLIPGTVSVAVAVILGFLLAPIVIR